MRTPTFTFNNSPQSRPGVIHAMVVARGRETAQENLTQAFLTFTQAADSLEKSYAQLQAEVARLHQELQRTNTELDRSLEENARVRGYLSQVLESLPCGVVVVNAAGETQVINPEARRLLELPGDGSGSSPGGLLQELEKRIGGNAGNGGRREHEWTAPGAPNRFLGVSRANIGKTAEGSEDIIWIVRDITDEKRVAAEREAARRAHALAEVATVLAHEIRNPLASMELFAGLLGDATAQMPETRQWVTHLLAGLRGLSATVNNVLQFHSQPTAQMVPSDLSRLLQETADFLEPLARQRGQRIQVENAVGKISVRADSHRLKQVFLNLSLNAFRAMAPGGRLLMALRWAPQFPGGAAQISFQDQGRGIDPELLERIFDPGFTTTPGSPGLGLAVCKKVIEQHGGEIRVEDKPGNGTTFSIFLPVAGEPR